MSTSSGARARRILPLVLAAGLALTGCRGDRVLRIESTPPGATVRLDDTVVGRTPIDIPFKDYGRRRLALYRPGYQTYNEPLKVDPRWWSRFPLDIITEIIIPLGLDDVRLVQIALVPDTGEEAAPATEEFYANALHAREESAAAGSIATDPAPDAPAADAPTPDAPSEDGDETEGDAPPTAQPTPPADADTSTGS